MAVWGHSDIRPTVHHLCNFIEVWWVCEGFTSLSLCWFLCVYPCSLHLFLRHLFWRERPTPWSGELFPLHHVLILVYNIKAVLMEYSALSSSLQQMVPFKSVVLLVASFWTLLLAPWLLITLNINLLLLRGLLKSWHQCTTASRLL